MRNSPGLYLSDGILYSHYSECDLGAYENFSFESDKRLYCPLTKNFYYHQRSMNALQQTRNELGRPMHINSGHRSIVYNAIVKGKVFSAHKWFAVDLDFKRAGIDPFEYASILAKHGFTGFGFASTYIHADMARPRYWTYSRRSLAMWQPYINQHFINRQWK